MYICPQFYSCKFQSLHRIAFRHLLDRQLLATMSPVQSPTGLLLRVKELVDCKAIVIRKFVRLSHLFLPDANVSRFGQLYYIIGIQRKRKMDITNSEQSTNKSDV